MKRFVSAFLGVAALVLAAVPAQATINDLVGTWKNTNAGTNGVTRVIVTRVTDAVTVQVFGKCSPSDCDWGTVNAEVYGSGAGQNAYATAAAVSAIFNAGFSETIVVLAKEGGGLKGKILTRFTDGSGRGNYVSTETFTKEAISPLSGLLGTVLNPGVLGLAAPQQDCIGFNNATAQVQNVGGSWKIVDGSMWLMDFGSNEAEAQAAFNVLRNHGFSQQCFVGRPDPSLAYWLAGNAAPTGNSAGEDCLAFNSATVEEKKIGGSWKIVDGDHWMFDFGANKAEADQAFQIIKYYGFTKTCYVGRPGPSLTYLLK